MSYFKMPLHLHCLRPVCLFIEIIAYFKSITGHFSASISHHRVYNNWANHWIMQKKKKKVTYKALPNGLYCLDQLTSSIF